MSRLFFALWPEPSWLAAVAELLRPVLARLEGRVQRPGQWHVTLEFLGLVPPQRADAVREAALAVRGAPFELVFDRVDFWRRSGIVCLTAGETPVALASLVAGLRTELAARGFTPERRPFRAHLTLARQAPVPAGLPAIQPLRWPVTQYALVESIIGGGGSNYTPLEGFPLAGPVAAEK